MKWVVIGADRETGDDKVLEIEADTEESASRRDARQGFLVSEVRAVAVVVEDNEGEEEDVNVFDPADEDGNTYGSFGGARATTATHHLESFHLYAGNPIVKIMQRIADDVQPVTSAVRPHPNTPEPAHRSPSNR